MFDSVEIAKKNAKNEDEEYFRWCILRHLNPFQSNPLRIWLERWGGSVGFLWDWISNILGYSDGVISPRRLNSDEHENTVNLLPTSNNDGKKH